jgi:glycosyltransferase involved in cell wall biosynthesis
MKILLISHTYWPEQNGVSQVVTTLAEDLVRRGCRVTVATQNSPHRLQTTHHGVRIESFNIRGNAVAGIKGEIQRYLRFVNENDFDLQHHHGCQIWGFDLLMDWFKNRNRPVLVTLHGLSCLGLDSYQHYFDKLAMIVPHIEAFSCLWSGCPEEQFLIENHAKQIKIIANGASLINREATVDLRQKWDIGRRFWMLNVSNHVATKGHRVLHRLAKFFPESVVTNIGNPILTERWGLGKWGMKLPCYYECKVQERLIANYFAIQTDRSTLMQAYHQADIFIMPSIVEASPLVVLEAMAAALPWIAFEAGNVRQLKGGLVVNNETELQSAIDYLQTNPDLRKQLATEGQQHIHQHHQWSVVLGYYWQWYGQTVIGSGFD